MSESVAKLLHEAKTRAGDQAVRAAKADDWKRAREWRAVAAEIDRVFRDAITAAARPA